MSIGGDEGKDGLEFACAGMAARPASKPTVSNMSPVRRAKQRRNATDKRMITSTKI